MLKKKNNYNEETTLESFAKLFCLNQKQINENIRV